MKIKHRSTDRRRPLGGGGLLLLLLATFFAFREALGLPLYHDDAVVMTWVAGQKLGQLFGASAGVPYYRPLSYLPW